MHTNTSTRPHHLPPLTGHLEGVECHPAGSAGVPPIGVHVRRPAVRPCTYVTWRGGRLHGLGALCKRHCPAAAWLRLWCWRTADWVGQCGGCTAAVPALHTSLLLLAPQIPMINESFKMILGTPHTCTVVVCGVLTLACVSAVSLLAVCAAPAALLSASPTYQCL